MIYSADFKKLAGKINHIDLIKYLSDLNWIEIPSRRDNVAIYQINKNNQIYQVDLPLKRELLDYETAMLKAIENISQSESKSMEQIILELLNPVSDIIRFRIINKINDTGNIFIEDAIKFYNNAKKLLVASAMDIKSPDIIHHTSRPDNEIQKLIDNCKFGQTEIGSYIISIVCPLADINKEQYTLFTPEEICAKSFTRQVTKKLISSIKNVKENIEHCKLNEFINKNSSTEDAISVNFLEALSDLSISSPENELEVNVKWAPTIKKNTLYFNSIKLSHDYYNPIKAIIEKFKISTIDNKSFIGKIKYCRADPIVEKRTYGQVELIYLNDNCKPASAKFDLKKEDYDKALNAHKDGKTVKVGGILNVSGKARTINPTSFEILDD